MNEVESFLAKQERYQCERLNAVLTVDQCAANRARKAEYGKPGLPAILQCEDCRGLGNAVAVNKKDPGPLMILDFQDDVELYQKMMSAKVTPNDVIGLLYMLFDNELRRTV